ncbi:hypothetical protein GH714_043459 [Hevea brasiliensis]|uniref:Uncharacterized protein n=1 Tax=Hevea brasiliensis TaxID=3981 RepID=A0A6A6K6T2_HEVBR|nr:hypothetical protein GH714_043459 [Hevea brasiliensis]
MDRNKLKLGAEIGSGAGNVQGFTAKGKDSSTPVVNLIPKSGFLAYEVMVRKCQRYFQVPEEQKVEVATLFFGGKADN